MKAVEALFPTKAARKDGCILISNEEIAESTIEKAEEAKQKLALEEAPELNGVLPVCLNPLLRGSQKLLED